MSTFRAHGLALIARPAKVLQLHRKPLSIACSYLGTSRSSLPTRSFTVAHRHRKHNEQQPTVDSNATSSKLVSRHASARKSGPKPSLRSAAVAAAVRSRKGFISRRGKTRYVDPEVETKEVIAYCAAERYSISKVEELLRAEGYRLDPFQTGLQGQVVHFQKAYLVSRQDWDENKDATDFGDVFVFPSGTIVTWNLPQREAIILLNGILLRAAEGSHLDALEDETLSYLEDSSSDSSEIIGDTIVLGTKTSENGGDATESRSSEDAVGFSNHETDTILAKIAFSSGLARSPKLAVLESQLNDAFDDTRAILSKLSAGGRLPFTQKFVIKKIADILSIRAQLNLYTDLTDTVPDMLWESRFELGLERYYDEVGRALDVDDRIDALNDKIQYTQDIATVLKEQLSENHGIRLEWIIIILITIEVVFELRRLYYEYKERRNPNSTENLLRKALRAPESVESIIKS